MELTSSCVDRIENYLVPTVKLKGHGNEKMVVNLKRRTSHATSQLVLIVLFIKGSVTMRIPHDCGHHKVSMIGHTVES